jgi:hypothetical protein
MTMNLKLAAARAKKDAARARLFEGVAEVKEHFTGSAIADRAMGRVQRMFGKRPATLATVAGSAALYLLRRPLVKWLGRKTKTPRATAEDATS